MKSESMLKPALVGAVGLGAIAALSTRPSFACCCCAYAIGGGVLASYMHVKSSHIPSTLGRGAGLGLLCGFLGTIIYGIFLIPIWIIRQNNIVFLEQLREGAERTSSNIPLESRQLFESLMNNESFGIIIFIFFVVSALVAFPLLSMLGATIGIALFEKRNAGPPSNAGSNFETPADAPPSPSAPPSDRP